jgi:hypothetical protein
MKIAKVIGIAATLTVIHSCVSISSSKNCEQSIVTTNCIDTNQIDPNGVCTMDYAPVCGCDEITYSNACVAEKNGVQVYVEGECCE